MKLADFCPKKVKNDPNFVRDSYSGLKMLDVRGLETIWCAYASSSHFSVIPFWKVILNPVLIYLPIPVNFCG